MKVLVKEKIGDSGVQLLRDAGLDVELGVDWDDGELERRIGEFDGILIRSATKLTADLLEQGRTGSSVVGRAGRGRGQRRRGRRHQARRGGRERAAVERDHRRRAHDRDAAGARAQACRRRTRSLTGGAWERSSFSGVELYEKTLGVLGFGRIGQLVAQRALGFGMRVVAFDAYVAEERFRELGVERAEQLRRALRRRPTSSRSTCRSPPRPENWLDAEAFAKMKDGVRVINVARGKLAGGGRPCSEALDSGKVAGAALDVFREEPVTEHPLFGYPNVVVTPHLGASTAEATDRAGYQAAEQVRGGAHRRRRHQRRERPGDRRRGPGGARRRSCRWRANLGRIAVALAEGTSVDALEVGVPRPHRRARHAPADRAGAQGRARRPHRGGRQRRQRAGDRRGARHRRLADEQLARARLHRPGAGDRASAAAPRTRVVGTTLGSQHPPHLLEAWGSRFNVQLEQHLAIFRYEDRPGMLGRVGTMLGEAGINIVSAAVGRGPTRGAAAAR